MKTKGEKLQVLVDASTRARWQSAANKECSGNLSSWIRACCEAMIRLCKDEGAPVQAPVEAPKLTATLGEGEGYFDTRGEE